MSIHNDYRRYGTEEEYEEWKQELISEYRWEQSGLYCNDDDIPNPDMCDSCKHNKYLYTKADGTKVWECDTHECEYEEIEE